MKSKINWDAIGITTSLACAIHCAILPLMLSSLSVFGINIIENVMFENLMILTACIIGYMALYHGFSKHHRNYLPIFLFAVGMALLLAKQAWHDKQLWFLIPAVICLLIAHLVNYFFCKKTIGNHLKDCKH